MKISLLHPSAKHDNYSSIFNFVALVFFGKISSAVVDCYCYCYCFLFENCLLSMITFASSDQKFLEFKKILIRFMFIYIFWGKKRKHSYYSLRLYSTLLQLYSYTKINTSRLLIINNLLCCCTQGQ